jgi:hypothetical protein
MKREKGRDKFLIDTECQSSKIGDWHSACPLGGGGENEIYCSGSVKDRICIRVLWESIVIILL